MPIYKGLRQGIPSVFPTARHDVGGTCFLELRAHTEFNMGIQESCECGFDIVAALMFFDSQIDSRATYDCLVIPKICRFVVVTLVVTAT